MKLFLFAVALVFLLPYAHASGPSYQNVSTQDYDHSFFYQDLFLIGFEYTLQKAVYGGGNNTIPVRGWSYYGNPIIVAVKNESDVLYFQGTANMTDYVLTFVVHYTWATGQVRVTNMSWFARSLPPGVMSAFRECSARDACIMPIPSPSDVAFSYAFNHTISKAIADHRLPNSTYKLDQIFSAGIGGGGDVSYEYIYTVVGGPNKDTYRISSGVGADISSWKSDQELLDALYLYATIVRAKGE